MNRAFDFLTPITYLLIIAIWLYVFVFYLKKIKQNQNNDKLLNVLLIILTIDAFRTIFEGIYFGIKNFSQLGFAPKAIYLELSQPQYMFLPKFVTLITGVLVLVMVLNKWLPAEKKRMDDINKLIEHKNADLTQKNRELKEAQSELEEHRDHLELLVEDKTKDLEKANEELAETNQNVLKKSEIINHQNTELKKTITQLKETQSQLVQSEKMASIGVLTAGVAHEINNPLNYIFGSYVALKNYFEEHGSKNEEETEILLDSIEQGVQRASKIVKGLNQFSRNDEKQDEICNIHAIITNCQEVLYNQYKRKAELAISFPEEKDVFVIGNSGKLHQVFINVLSNSIQAIDSQGRIEIEVKIEGNSAVIKISDDGCGVSEKNLSKIADPFFTTKSPGEGTGLGLSICYSIIKDHSGSIEFQSKENEGTTVTLKIPLKQ